jgi:REP element-mobilizing transposase RayT
MSIDQKFLAGLTEDNIYHIYNRTNNREPLFLSDDNRRFFLKRYADFLSPFSDTFCWCLLPNHFHFLVKIKSPGEIKSHLQNQEVRNAAEKDYLSTEQPCSKVLEKAFHRFFTSYSMAFNKQHNRKGNLFHRPFKRIEVIRKSHFTQAVIYIHTNPLKHKIATDFTKYQWSSWQSLLSDAPTRLLRKELMDWFGNKEQFIKAHQYLSQYYYESDIAIED